MELVSQSVSQLVIFLPSFAIHEAQKELLYTAQRATQNITGDIN